MEWNLKYVNVKVVVFWWVCEWHFGVHINLASDEFVSLSF